MANCNAEVVIRSILDPACVYLWQHITQGGVNVVIPEEEPPSGRYFIHKLPEKRWHQEEFKCIIGVFNHTSEAHAHFTTVAANISTLAKGMDRETLQIIMKLAVCPLVQMHILEWFVNPIEEKRPHTTEAEWLQKVEKMLLPKHNVACLAHKMKNGPTRILAAAIWLKLCNKYFNTSTVKEACELFQVRAKQLSHVLTWKKYLRGSDKKVTSPHTRGKKRKIMPSKIAVKKARVQDDDNNDQRRWRRRQRRLNQVGFPCLVSQQRWFFRSKILTVSFIITTSNYGASISSLVQEVPAWHNILHSSSHWFHWFLYKWH